MRRPKAPPFQAAPPRISNKGPARPSKGVRKFSERASKSPGMDAEYKPRLRDSLDVLQVNGGNAGAKGLPGTLRLIDPRSGRQHEFETQEHILCRAADGETSIAAMHKRLSDMSGQPMSEGEIIRFFRRLKVQGLLDLGAGGSSTKAAARPQAAPEPYEPEDASEPAKASTPEQAAAPKSGERPEATPLAVRPDADAAEVVPAPHAEPIPSVPAHEPTAQSVIPGRFGIARAASGNATFPETEQAEPPNFGRPAAGIRNPRNRRAAPPAEDDLSDLFDEDAPRRPRPQGPAGGMMGGGMMGAGGMMGGMGGGMMGGMMAGRGGPVAQPTPPEKAGPAQLPLMNPGGLLKALYVLGWPLKFVIWAIIPLVAVAGLSMLNNLPALLDDVRVMLSSYSFITKVLVALVIVNLSSRLAQGVAIIAHGGQVKSLGIALVLGLIPRIYIDTSAIDQLDRKGQLWAHGAPLLARLFAFAIGIIAWAVSHDQGGSFPIIALTVAQFGLLTFTITSWPLFPADGMRWFGAFFNEPKLIPKAVMAFRHVFLKRELPPMMDRAELWPLTLFAIGAILSTLFLVGVFSILLLGLLEQSLGGLGVLLFLGMVAIATLWFIALTRMNTSKVAGVGRMAGAAMPAGMRAGGLRKPDTAPAAAPSVPLPNRAKVVWALLLCGGLIVAFLPYTYESGGEAQILPLARGQAVARSDGEIVEMLVREGDAVTEGQALAQLSDWDQLSDVAVAEARLTKARAELRRLEAGARPEEVELARAQLRRAQADVAFRRAEVERARELIASQTVSRATLDRAESEYATAFADLEYARASLALVESGATTEELEIARAEVDRLERELAYNRDELSRTSIRAPIDGYVVTPDLQLRRGDYLREGDLLLEIEQSQTVYAVIAIPEADAAMVVPGQNVRLRVRSGADTELHGTVESVAPVAEDLGFGRIVRATAEFPNEDGSLRSAMTGHAKIEGVEMRVWEAYLRSIRRFIQIDVWSWIP